MSAYSPHEPKPLLGYAVLTAALNGAAAAYVATYRRSPRELPRRMPVGDFVLMAAAPQKLSRLIAKDRVTSFLRSPFTRYAGEAGLRRSQRSRAEPACGLRWANCWSVPTASASGSPPDSSAGTPRIRR
jgi:hypothetical protein